MKPENQKVQSITEAPTAQFNQHADEAVAINAADKMTETVTEYKTAGAERARMAKIGVAIGAGVLALGGLLHLTSPNQPADHNTPANTEMGTYTVQPGDTLSGVAKEVTDNTPQQDKLQPTAELIRDANGLPQTPELGIGQKLSVPADADLDKQQPGVQLEPAPGELPIPNVEQGHTGTSQ